MSDAPLTDDERERLCICPLSDGLTDDEAKANCDAYAAAVESIKEAAWRDGQVAALEDAAKEIAELVPYGYGMNSDGTEDRTAASYIEGHREAWQTIMNRAAELSDVLNGSRENKFRQFVEEHNISPIPGEEFDALTGKRFTDE